MLTNARCLHTENLVGHTTRLKHAPQSHFSSLNLWLQAKNAQLGDFSFLFLPAANQYRLHSGTFSYATHGFELNKRSKVSSRPFSCTLQSPYCMLSSEIPKLPSVKARLDQLGIKPKMGLGQNFLMDSAVVKGIIKAADIQPGDRVLEIGPGTGVLTAQLLQAGASVTAIEKVVCADFLQWRKKEEMMFPKHDTRAKVVANLPYNITTDCLKRLLPLRAEFSVLVLMVQAETAQRLVAACAGDKDYRAISVRVQYYSDPAFVSEVQRNAFFPAPNVDSAVISFHLKEELPSVICEKRFFQLVATSFVHKRKMLRNNLKGLGFKPSQVEAALVQIEKVTSARPAELTMLDYVHLHHILEGNAKEVA